MSASDAAGESDTRRYDHAAGIAELTKRSEGPRVIEILRKYTDAYLKAHARQAVLRVRDVLGKVALCRTSALGGHAWHCETCGHRHATYHSCGQRQCPQCSGAVRARWFDQIRKRLLPVPHMHLVFTLPKELSSLALGNRRPLYNLLFHTAWAALKQMLTDEKHLGIDPAAAMVLHTWDQHLAHHAHVHAIVPAGGPSVDGTRWIGCRRSRKTGKLYLVSNKALGRLFRGKFLAGLKRLWRRGELKLGGPWSRLLDGSSWEQWLAPLYSQDWVVNIQAPPPDCEDVTSVLKYLTGYIVGGPISDRRLESHDDGQVTFWARSRRKGRRRQRQRITLSGVEFTRRWSLHVLPSQFVRVRYYGGISNRNCKSYLEHCRALLTAAQIPLEPDLPSSVAPEDAAPILPAQPICPQCGNRLTLAATRQRPSWREVFSDPCSQPLCREEFW